MACVRRCCCRIAERVRFVGRTRKHGTAGEEVQEGNCLVLRCLLSDPVVDVFGLGFGSMLSICFGSCSVAPLLFWILGHCLIGV